MVRASTTSQTVQRALDALEVSGAAYLEPRVGHTDTFGPLGVEVLNPPAGVGLSDVHDSALATRITFGDTRWLLTGDIEADVEQRMVDTVGDQLDADVHQVGHHGSTTSTTPVFLEAVDPTVAVYSAGQDNTYGHPQTEVLDRLNTSGVQVYGTDANGTVTATGDGTSIRFVPQVGDPYTHTVDDPADPPADVPVDPVPSFTDIAGSGHEQAILVVAQAYIAGGFTDGAYRVAIFVTRGQMATFLTRALKLTPTDPPYPDAAGTTHAQAIGAVAQANIAGGYGDGTYRPGEPVTRGRMATFLARVFDLEVVG